MSDHRIEHPQLRDADLKGWRFESDELENASYPFVDDDLDFHDGWSAIRRRRRPVELGPTRAGHRARPTHH